MPVALFAYSSGLPVKYTGAPADGGLDCSSCHNSFGAANSDPKGSITIQTASTYSPGQTQPIRLTISYPQAMKWGFQLTARSVNDPTVMAGTFTPTSDVRVYCGNGGEAPCGGNLEFATQTAQSLSGGAATSTTVEVQWTPPANEVGPIVLYAAGVAANGDALPTGDHVYTANVKLAAQGACTLSKKPSIRRVVNAGSFGSSLTANGMATIIGSDFQVPGRTRLAGPGDIVSNAYPKQLGCIAVEVNGVRAPVTYVQTDQLNFQMPSSLPSSGDVTVRVIANPDGLSEQRSDPATVTVQSYAPAFFTFDGTSIATRNADYSISADPAVVPGGRPAKPGDIVLLYGTGFGATNPSYGAGVVSDLVLAPVRNPVTVTIGGITLSPADVLYAGVTPGSISGLYQFNVRIPSTVPDGNVPVTASTGGVSTTPGTTIAVRK